MATTRPPDPETAADIGATATDIPPELDTRFLGHPRGLSTLFFTEMWERLSYYGMRALLVLFMTTAVATENPGLGFGVERAGAIYGLYTALVYLLVRLGHDERGILYLLPVSAAVLLATFALTDPQKNINWVFGPGRSPQARIPRLAYLALVMIAFAVGVYLPTHLALRALLAAD